MPGESLPQGLWLPPRVATLLVAASDSLDRVRAQADYICDGVADDVEINAALNALPTQGGRVMLAEGQYVLADPIIIPDHDVVLDGQGWSAFINGNNLLTNNHAIQISGKSNCAIKNLSIRTQAGGGKTCHCVFLENGCHDTLIENVYFEDSDSDAIHIGDGSHSRIKIFNNFIEGADNHGIHIRPGALDITQYIHIYHNHIFSAGGSGINLSVVCAQHQYMIIEGNSIGTCSDDGITAYQLFESMVVDNYIRLCDDDGILLAADCDNNLIENNFCNSNGGYGLNIAAASCSENRIKNNKLIGNTNGAINEAGTLTQMPFIFAEVPNPNTNIGTHPATLLTDGLEVVDRINLYIPIEFQELVRVEAVLVPGGTGNMRRSVATDWGMICSGEIYNSDSGAIAAGEVAVSINHLECLDITAAFTGVAPVGPGRKVGIAFTRHGNHANDTVNANCYLLGVRMQYV